MTIVEAALEVVDEIQPYRYCIERQVPGGRRIDGNEVTKSGALLAIAVEDLLAEDWIARLQ